MTQTTGTHRLELVHGSPADGYRALCSCGWHSQTTPDETAAIEAGDEHAADQS